MLIYRLIHFEVTFQDIDAGLKGRQKELCKPLLQLFHNTKPLREIQAALQLLTIPIDCARLSVSENPVKTITDHGKGQN